MKSQIIKKFPLCTVNKCLETVNHAYFEIIDDANRSIIKLPPERGHFKVSNSTRRNINFLAIDKVLLDDSHPDKRCDCAIFDNTCFSFVEIKGFLSSKQKPAAKKTAIKQLKATLDVFTAEINFDNYDLEAHICIGNRKNTIPAFDATSQDAKAEFKLLYNARLLEGTKKDY